MRFLATRLRRGELLVAASAVVLLVLMLVVNWYGPGSIGPASGAVNGWDGLLHLRWLIAVTIAASLLLVLVQATRPAPAVPLTMSVIVTLLAVPTLLWLGYRVLIRVPPHQKVAPYLGLACAIGIAFGGYLSMRDEGVAPTDERAEIPTVSQGAAQGGT
jgi:hypothetical protein